MTLLLKSDVLMALEKNTLKIIHRLNIKALKILMQILQKNMRVLYRSMGMTYVISKYLDKVTALRAKQYAETLEEARWVRRSQLTPPRQVENSSCAYDFCGHSQMPKHMIEFLKSIAPNFEEHRLAEIAINRYNVGDYLGKHRDVDHY